MAAAGAPDCMRRVTSLCVLLNVSITVPGL